MNNFPNSILTNKPLAPLFSLGRMHISDFIKPGEEPRSKKCELALGFDEETGLVQLTSQPDASEMWGDIYWYKSGTNQFMKDALKDVVEKTDKFVKSGTTSDYIWLDIASNDGTLLSLVDPSKYFRVGIDPSSYPESYNNAEIIVKDYFSKSAYFQNVPQKAKIVSCCAMFYDLSDPIGFLRDVESVMRDDGVFVLQLSYTPAMLIQYELGNICHEHIAYYTLASLEFALKRGGFEILDLELNNVNGGSIRVYCSKIGANLKFKTQADRDVAKINVDALRAYEKEHNVNTAEGYLSFFKEMLNQRELFLKFLREEKEKGKTFWGYGASTKGNTVLQWYGLGPNDITKIVERQDRKVGLVCAGSNIPIVSEQEGREQKPDYMIVFPWHFIGEFKEREKEYLQSGGKFVVLSPKFEVIGYEN